MNGEIQIRGARCNNLKNIDLNLPLGKLIVFVGPSGSGKGSLAVDTLLHEGRRQLLQVLGHSLKTMQLSPAKVDAIVGMPTTVGLSLKSRRKFGHLQTVGDYAGLSNLIQRIFIDEGTLHSPLSGEAMPVHSQAQITNIILNDFNERKIAIMAPVVFGDLSGPALLAEISRMGFGRIEVDGQMMFVEDAKIKADSAVHLVVDRMKVRLEKSKERVFESIHTASVAGRGRVKVVDLDTKETWTWSMSPWSEIDGVGYPSAGFEMFNHRNVSSACTQCSGVGIDKDSPEKICGFCKGTRLFALANGSRRCGVAYSSVITQSISSLLKWVESVDHGVSAELIRRIKILTALDLDHLTASQSIDSLSSGEYSRLSQSNLFSNPVPHALVVVDEPSMGLTKSELSLLLGQYRKLIELGCTVLLSDHHPFIAQSADHLVQFGPGSGALGGEVVGVNKDIAIAKNQQEKRIQQNVSFVTVSCCFRTLKLPKIKLQPFSMVCLSGKSGMGKTVLAYNCIVRELRALLKLKTPSPLIRGMAGDLSRFRKLVSVDDGLSVSGKRSCVATRIGVWTVFRQLLSQVKEAKMLGLKAGYFSFNNKGGRCENCAGMGTVNVVAAPLPPQVVQCPLCDGSRFNEQARSVRYKGFNAVDLLEMDIETAAKTFSNIPKLSRVLNAMTLLGLGYIQLGLPTALLSTGEARRLNLGLAISKANSGEMENTLVVIDEPTAGLDDQNTTRVADALETLRNDGATIMCISNHPAIVSQANRVYSVI